MGWRKKGKIKKNEHWFILWICKEPLILIEYVPRTKHYKTCLIKCIPNLKKLESCDNKKSHTLPNKWSRFFTLCWVCVYVLSFLALPPWTRGKKESQIDGKTHRKKKKEEKWRRKKRGGEMYVRWVGRKKGKKKKNSSCPSQASKQMRYKTKSVHDQWGWPLIL